MHLFDYVGKKSFKLFGKTGMYAQPVKKFEVSALDPENPKNLFI